MKKRLLKLICVLSLLCLTAACGKDFDAAGYVQGYMDTCLKDNGTEYAKLCAVETSETTKLYNDGIDDVMNGWLSGVTMDSDTKSTVRKAICHLFQSTRYTVNDAKKQDDGSFLVSVDIQPLQISLTTSTMKKLEEEALAEYTDDNPEDETINQKKLGSIIGHKFADYLNSNTKKPLYGKTVSVTATVSVVDKQYALSAEDQSTLITSTLSTK